MTTLPPEGEPTPIQGSPADGAAQPTEPATPAAPSVPEVPSVPAAAEVAPSQPVVPPIAPPVAPQQPAFGAPQQPVYGAPQQPTYGAPHQPTPEAPQYGAPTYSQPGAPGYAPQPATADPLSNITLSYWLSVFFYWVPSLIFYLIERDRANPQVRALHAANLNFSLIRTGVLLIGSIFGGIPVLGAVIGPIAGLASVVFFVFHIMAAVKVSEAYRSGSGDPFLFNLQIVK